MPYRISKRDDEYCVIKRDNNKVIPGGCHKTKEEAMDHIQAIHANHAYNTIQAFLDEEIDKNSAEYLEMQALTASGAETLPWSGVIAVEGIETGDHRVFAANSITWDDPPLPLSWQRVSAEGHKSSVVIGRVDNIYRDGDTIKGNGVIFTGDDAPEEANQYRYLIENGAAGGVSVDGDSAQYDLQKDEDGRERISFNQIRIRALTAVAIPAFAEANIELDAEETEELARRKKKKKKIADRVYSWAKQPVDSLLASAIKVKPPIEWFENPQLEGPTPLTVSQDGWVFGHIALWNTCHIGLPGCTKPPKNGTYQYFHTGEIETEEGDSVEVGHLTFRTGHAGHHLNAASAAAHYDHTGMVGSDVRAGEDKYGIWVAGALRPHLTDEDIREFRAAPISGDWRRINSKMEMVGALSVNVPGFPVPRTKARVLTAAGEPQTLIYSEDFGELEPNDVQTFSHIEIEARQALRAELTAQVIKLVGLNPTPAPTEGEIETHKAFKTELATRVRVLEAIAACGMHGDEEHTNHPFQLSDTDKTFLDDVRTNHEAALNGLAMSHALGLSPEIQLYSLEIQEEILKSNLKINNWLAEPEAPINQSEYSD